MARRFDRRSPGHDFVVGTYAGGTQVDVDAAVSAARTSFDSGPWRWTSGADKARVLRGVAAQIEAEADSLALRETLESGKPISQAREEMAGAAGIWYYAATLAQHAYGDAITAWAQTLAMVVRVPIGVVGVITPWNFPLLIASQKIPFALAAGCSVVIKASDFTPATTTRLVQLLHECGLPDGVANIVHGAGDVGAYLASHPGTDMTSFTGSTGVGRSIMARRPPLSNTSHWSSAARTPKSFSPTPTSTRLWPAPPGPRTSTRANAATPGRGSWYRATSPTRSSSELPTSATRSRSATHWLRTPRSERSSATPTWRRSPSSCTAASPTAPPSSPEGAASTARTGRGRFFAPTVIDHVGPASRLGTAEVFGPVLSVIRVKDLAEAVAVTNSTPYGLSSGIWTNNIDSAMTYARSVRAGTVWVNSWMAGFPEVPFGGVGDSGIGRELGRGSIDEYTESKSVIIKAGAALSLNGSAVLR